MFVTTVRLYATKEAETQFFIQTGSTYSNTLILNFKDFSPEQRQEWVQLAGVPTTSISLSAENFRASIIPETAEQWLTVAREYHAHKAALKNAEEEKQAKAQAAATAKAAATLSEMEQADDVALLRLAATLPHLTILAEHPEYSERLQATLQRIQQLRDQQTAEQQAREQAAAAQQEAEKAERQRWAAEYGSDHLKKAVGAGYDCKRLYLQERISAEYPEYVLDFDSEANWNDRSCPSEAALDEALRVGGTVYWLTRDADGEPQEEGCEIVAFRPEHFLGTWIYRMF